MDCVFKTYTIYFFHSSKSCNERSIKVDHKTFLAHRFGKAPVGILVVHWRILFSGFYFRYIDEASFDSCILPFSLSI